MSTNDTVQERTDAIIRAALFRASETALALRLQVMRYADLGVTFVPAVLVERATDDLLEQIGDVVGEVNALVCSLGNVP